MTANLTQLARELVPLMLPMLEDAGLGASVSVSSGTGGAFQHALSGAFHTGTLADTQFPQGLLRDGSRSLLGNLAVAPGVTIDGVDLSVFKAAYDSHLLGDSHSAYAHAEGAGVRPAAYANRLNKALLPGTGIEISPGGNLTQNQTVSLDEAVHITWTGNQAWTQRTTHQGGIYLGFSDTVQFGSADAVLYATSGDTDLLKTDNHFRVGGLLGVGTDPSARLHVLGAGGTTLVKLEGSTGNNLVVDADANNMVRFGTSDFASGLRGWRIDGDGTAEFNNLFVRGELHATIFVADEMYATGGTAVFLTSSKVENPKTLGDNVLPGINGSFTLVVQASYATGFSYFAVDDVLRVKTMMQNGIGGIDIYDVYLQVTAVSSNGDRDIANGVAGTYDVTCIRRQGGNTGVVIPQGTAVVKWGEYNQGTDTFTGGVLITSDLNDAPYMDIFTVSSEGNEAWTQAPTPRVRVGLLDGITDPDLNPSGWGLWGDNVFLDGKIVAREGRILNNVIIGGGSTTAQQIAGWGWGANTTFIDGNQIFTGTVNADKLNVGVGGGNLIIGANWNDDPVGGALVMPGSWGRAFYGTVNYHRLTKDTTGSITGTIGEHYIEASVTASGGAGMQSEPISVDVTRTYTLSAFAKRLSGTGTTSIGLECYNSGGLLGYRFPALNAQAATLTGFASSGGYRYHGKITGTGAGHNTFIAGTTSVRVFMWIAESSSGTTSAALWQPQFEQGELLTAWAPGLRGNIQIDNSQIMAGTPGAQRTTIEASGVKSYNASNVVQVHWDSGDGIFKAGAGAVQLSAVGMILNFADYTLETSYLSDPASVVWGTRTAPQMALGAYAYRNHGGGGIDKTFSRYEVTLNSGGSTYPRTGQIRIGLLNSARSAHYGKIEIDADSAAGTGTISMIANPGGAVTVGSGVTITGALTASGGASVTGNLSATGTITATGMGIFSSAGIRLPVVSTAPTGGASGDIMLYENGATRRIYARLGTTWRFWNADG